MSKGLLGKKLGMTSVFGPNGNQHICTVIQCLDNVVTQVKTIETDGYSAVQIGAGERKDKHTTKAMQGHFKASGAGNKRHLREFRDFGGAVSVGDAIKVEDLFSVDEKIDISGTTKGRGFQGVVKRHGFGGVGMATHGQHNRQRAPGSIGQSSYPARVFKGIRMAGQMGNARQTIKNLRVIQVLPDSGLILVKGNVPGPKNGIVELRKRAR